MQIEGSSNLLGKVTSATLVDKLLLIKKFTERKEILYNQTIRDFGGGSHRFDEHRECKYWKEAIERGEFDLDPKTCGYVVTDECMNLVEFMIYMDRKVAQGIADHLNSRNGCTRFSVTPLQINQVEYEKLVNNISNVDVCTKK